MAAVAGGALLLRLVYPACCPPGFNPDEPQHASVAAYARSIDSPLFPASDGVCVLLAEVFQAPLRPWTPVIGTRLALRLPSMIGGAAAALLVFAVCRVLGLGVLASICGAVLYATAPWSLFFGRLSDGGELLWFALLLLLMLSRLAFAPRAGPPELMCGTVALTALLYDYWAGAILLAWAGVSMCLAPTWRRRLACLAIAVLSGLLWLPWWRTSPYPLLLTRVLLGAPSTVPTWQIATPYPASPGPEVVARLGRLWDALTGPHAVWAIWSEPAVALHPLIALALAGFGLVSQWFRRAAFLLGLFVLGLLPTLLPAQGINGHRMLYAFPLLPIAMACGVQSLPYRKASGTLLAMGIAGWGIWFFFDQFWLPGHITGFPFVYE